MTKKRARARTERTLAQTRRELTQLDERRLREKEQRASIQAEKKINTNDVKSDYDFIAKRISELPPTIRPGEDFDATWAQIIIDLVDSDIPLSRRMRTVVAGTLRRLAFPNPARDRREKRQGWLWGLLLEKHHLLLTPGITPAKVERVMAENRNMTVEGLRNKIQRAKRG